MKSRPGGGGLFYKLNSAIMTRNKFVPLFFWLLLCLVFIRHAAAEEIIDDIVLRPGASGEVNLEIKFAVPVQYVRHFPLKKSPHSTIFFNILSSVPKDQWQSRQAHRAPPSDLIRDITVSIMDPGTGPKIQLDFSRPAEFTVSPGRNGQSLMIHITAEILPKNDATPVPGPSIPAVIPAVVVPAVVATAPKLPAPAAGFPPTAVSGKPGTAPAPAPKPAPAPIPAPVPAAVAAPVPASAPAATSAVPTGDVTAPSIVLPPSGKLLRLPLGGKDGLPVFPDIEQVAPESAQAAPPANLPPAQQLKRVNDQAALLMLKGGKDLLDGKPFAATESFNGVLNLPPNRYTEDAQLWVGITREKSGQLQKGILEFQTYLKLYPTGKSVSWVNNRLAVLKIAAPGIFAELAKPPQAMAPAKVKNTEFQTMEFGSLGMYYYTGGSRIKTSGGNQAAIPAISVVDQKSLMTNINMTANTYNNEYDNRLVFQDFYARNLLPKQKNNNRLGAAFYEFRDRIEGFSTRIGRQSGLGGGVMGRFDGISAGIDVFSDYRFNVVGGQLADITLDSKPKFYGTSVDFGIKSPIGGSLYAITQKADGLKDRQAVGGNLRYFNPSFNLMSMFDYDTQFKALNMITLQGAYNSGGSGTDYNFIIDRRRSPILDVRNAVNGTATPVSTLLQNGWTFQDLILLANQRTGSTSSVAVGMTNHLNEKWNAGTDVSVARNSGLPASGTMLPDGSVGLEGFVPAIPSSPNVWTLSERLTGNGIIRPHDITNFIVSYSKGPTSASESFQFSNHSDLQEKWSLDLTLHFSHQGDKTGGVVNDISPTSRLTYRMLSNLSLDGQLGLDLTKFSNGALQTQTTTFRYFASFGFQWNF